VTVHHRFDGDAAAPVLVLAGSLGTTNAMWEPQLAALAERFRVLRYDHPGHGDSPVPDGPLSIEDLGVGVLALLDDVGLERVSFCGLSLGGMVGMWLARHAPERVDRLVLCCTSARFAPPERWTERAATVRRHGLAAVADTVLERWFTPRFREREPEAVERYRGMLLSTPAEGYARCCEVVRDADLREAVGAIVAPTLVIAGTEDPAVAPDDIRLLAERIAGARVVDLRAAHLASVEQPEAFCRVLLGHLAAAVAA
jgi:3-oxoadipate enol-lactonase